MTKIFILDRPVLVPGKCANCGSPGVDDGRKFIDISLTLIEFGAVYFCVPCFAEIASKIGYFPESVVDELKLKMQELLDNLQEERAENVKLRTALDAVDFLPRVDPEPDIPSSPSDKILAKVRGKSTEDKLGPSEQTTKRGSKDVQPDDGTKSADTKSPDDEL